MKTIPGWAVAVPSDAFKPSPAPVEDDPPHEQKFYITLKGKTKQDKARRVLVYLDDGDSIVIISESNADILAVYPQTNNSIKVKAVRS